MDKLQAGLAGISDFVSTPLGHTLLLGFCVICMLLCLFALMTARKRSSSGDDRISGLRGKVENIERTLNELRTDVTRSIEFFRGDSGYIKQEIEEIRVLLEDRPAGGSGGSGGGGVAGGGGGSTIPDGTTQTPPTSTAQTARPYHLVPPIEDRTSQLLSPTPVEPTKNLRVKLGKTRRGFFEKVKGLFVSTPKIDQSSLDDLEALLISSDLGVRTSARLLQGIKDQLQIHGAVSEEALRDALRDKMMAVLEDKQWREVGIAQPGEGSPRVVLVVGVNGVGKTTSCAKLGLRLKNQGLSVLLVAADTFRAAAVEQLVEWGKRLEIPVVRGANEAKPQTVVYDAMERAKRENIDVVLIDTAGRLHTRANLMQELSGVRSAITKHVPDGPHETILVIDGSTGQNAITQAAEFNAAVPLTGLIVTKLDGTPKGGVVIAVKEELGIAVRYIGVGEAKEDLKPFDAAEFVDAILGGEDDGALHCAPSGSAGAAWS